LKKGKLVYINTTTTEQIEWTDREIGLPPEGLDIEQAKKAVKHLEDLGAITK